MSTYFFAYPKNGDTETFSILVERYHRHLLNFIFRIVGDAGITEDIGQEVFLSVYKSLKDFDENRGTPFSAWHGCSVFITDLCHRRRMILSFSCFPTIEEKFTSGE